MRFYLVCPFCRCGFFSEWDGVSKEDTREYLTDEATVAVVLAGKGIDSSRACPRCCPEAWGAPLRPPWGDGTDVFVYEGNT